MHRDLKQVMNIHPPNTSEKLGFHVVKEATARHIKTPMGEDELVALQPHGLRAWVERALAQTAEMMHLLSHEDHFPLDELPDISEALKKAKIAGGWLAKEWILAVGLHASSGRKLKQFIRSREESYPSLFELSTGLISLKELEKEISRVLNEQGNVRDNASSELASIRRQLQSRKSDVRKALQSVIRKANKNGYMDEQEATLRNGRMVIPIKAEHKRKINGFVHDVSSTGQTIYLEPAEVLNINNDIRELESREYREIERILIALTSIIRNYVEPLMLNAEAIGQLDVIHAKARLGLELRAEIPIIGTSNELKLAGVRNPVLLLKPEISREEVVPLTLTMNADEQGLIITGPNAGGKSVAMKTVGLSSMMALSGFALPSKEPCIIPVISQIFMDMGDEQSIENDLSTFSSRLEWMKTCVEQADKESLILIDEAGSGTDPEEGTALYQSLITHLTEKGARMIVTTHHGALKVFAHEHPKWVNASMAFNQAALSPTYIFEKGIPGSSYAFDIAQRLGVPSEITSEARLLLGDSKNKMELLISELQQKTYEAEKLRDQVEREKRSLDQKVRDYENKFEKITRERDEIRQNALQEAQKIIGKANSKVEETIKKIVESAADKETVKSLKKSLLEDQKSVDGELKSIEKRRKAKTSTEPPVIGDEVAMMDSNTTGELIEKNGKQAVVLMNGLRVKTKFNKLVKVQAPKKKKKQTIQISKTPSNTVLPASYSLDIRGARGDEAISKVTRFIDNALSRGLNQVEIVHGKGEGILRKLVHEHLSMRKDVGSFEVAPIEQGGHGCTVVHLG